MCVQPPGGGMLGRHHSSEGKANISAALKGRTFSAEHKEKIRQALLGRAPANKGKPSPFKGMTYAQIGRGSSPLFGRTPSEEARQNMRVAALKRWGLTTLSPIRDGTLSRQWRLVVLKRDNFTCQKCGIRQDEILRTNRPVQDRLHAHHIKPWRTHPELRFEVSNGITYCWPCHKVEEGIGRPRVS